MLVRLGLMPDVLVVVSFHGIWIMIVSVSMHVSVLVLVLLAIVFVFVCVHVLVLVSVLWTHLVHLPTGKRLQVISAILRCVRSVPPAPLYPLGSS